MLFLAAELQSLPQAASEGIAARSGDTATLQPGDDTERLTVRQGCRPSGLMRALCCRSSPLSCCSPCCQRWSLLWMWSADLFLSLHPAAPMHARWPCLTIPGSLCCSIFNHY